MSQAACRADFSAEVRAALAKLDPFATVHPFRLPGPGALVISTDPAEAESYRIVGGSRHGGRLVDGHRLQPLATTTAAHAVGVRAIGWRVGTIPIRRHIMSIVVRFPPSNVTKQQYESVRSALTDAGDFPPDGCQLHVAFGDENNIRVSEVFESREKLEAFSEKLRPRLEEAGIQLSGEPEIFEAHRIDTF